MSLMQPKWFSRLDVAVGHLVWVQRDGEVAGGTVRALGNEGHYKVTTRGGIVLVGVRRTDLCLKGQVGAVTGEPATEACRAELQVITPSGGGDADDAASIARSSGVWPMKARVMWRQARRRCHWQKRCGDLPLVKGD